MTTICLNEEAIRQNDMCLGEILLMLAICNKADLKRAEVSLIQKVLLQQLEMKMDSL